MAIISVSVNDKILSEIDRLQEQLGFSGRSEVIRAGTRMLIEDNKQKENLTGEINVILLTVHDKQMDDFITRVKHKFDEIINTQIHSHFKEGKCLEIFLLEGSAEEIKKLFELLQASGKVDYVKLIVA